MNVWKTVKLEMDLNGKVVVTEYDDENKETAYCWDRKAIVEQLRLLADTIEKDSRHLVALYDRQSADPVP